MFFFLQILHKHKYTRTSERVCLYIAQLKLPNSNKKKHFEQL